MKRIAAVSVLALGLAGCNATVYDSGYYRPRPVIDLQTPVYVAPRPYYEPRPYYSPRPVYNPYVYRPHPRCEIIERHTPYGIRRERVCR
jgi:hypothetical protein